MGAPATSVDATDQRILLALLRSPVASYAELAVQLEMAPASLAERFRRLTRHGVVRITGRTLPSFGGGHVYLVRARGRPRAVAAFAERAARYVDSRWVRLSRDGGELMCGRVTRHPADDPVLCSLGDEPGLAWVRMHELLEVWSGTERTTPTAPRAIDDTDAALLRLLAVNGRREARWLAERLQVDPSTVSRRRRRLIDEGILYFEADVHPAALGGTGDAMLWMRVPPGHIRTVGRALRRRLDVRFAAATSDECDVVAHVHVLDRRTLVTFVDEVLAELGVTHADIVPMGRTLKRNAV